MRAARCLVLLAAVTATVGLFTGCEDKGPAQKAGEKIDDAAKKAGEKLGDAAEKAGDAAKKAGDKTSDALKGK